MKGFIKSANLRRNGFSVKITYMKKLFGILFVLIALQTIVFSQTKINEYREVSTDLEGAYLDDFAVKLMQNNDNKGLFVVYVDENRERLGNIFPYIEGVKSHFFDFRKISSDRISFIIAQGKPNFTREFYIIPKGEKLPEIKEADLTFDNLNQKYLYATSCLDCEPAVPALFTGNIDWKKLAKVLKENPNYQLVININGNTAFISGESDVVSSEKYVKNLKTSFWEKHGINKTRIKYIINKGNKEETPTSAAFYIVPQKIEK